MYVVATGTLHATVVHQALHVVIALHPILVRGIVRVMRKCCLAQLVFFQSPEILQLLAHAKADRPIIVAARNWVSQRLLYCLSD